MPATDFTVLLMMPECSHDTECCWADRVRRVWISADTPEVAGAGAAEKLINELDWQDTFDADEFEIIAIFAGQQFDLHQA